MINPFITTKAETFSNSNLIQIMLQRYAPLNRYFAIEIIEEEEWVVQFNHAGSFNGDSEGFDKCKNTKSKIQTQPTKFNSSVPARSIFAFYS